MVLKTTAEVLALGLFVLIFSASSFAQITLSWPPELSPVLGPEAFSSLPADINTSVKIQYVGNKDTFSAPFRGTLATSVAFKEIVANGSIPFQNVAVYVPGDKFPFDPIIRNLQALGAAAIVLEMPGSDNRLYPGASRYDSDGRGGRDIRVPFTSFSYLLIPVFQVSRQNVATLGPIFYGPNATLFNFNNNITIQGQDNIYTVVFMGAGTFAIQAIVLVYGTLVLAFNVFIIYKKWKYTRGKVRLALVILGFLLLGSIATLCKVIFAIDPMARLDIFPTWFRYYSSAMYLPFNATNGFLLISFWSNQMSRKGVYSSSRTARLTPRVMSPLFFLVSLVMLITLIILRDDFGNPINVLLYLLCYFIQGVFVLYFWGYLVYGSVQTNRYLRETKNLDQARKQLRRVIFTQRNFIFQSGCLAFCALIYGIILFTPFGPYNFFFWQAALLVLITADLSTLFILQGRFNPFQKEVGNDSSTRENQTSVMSGNNTRSQVNTSESPMSPHRISSVTPSNDSSDNETGDKRSAASEMGKLSRKSQKSSKSNRSTVTSSSLSE